jgi:NAD(P)-dependent dehydrogenase (short-subunit alcohol dehydrogenase family)
VSNPLYGAVLIAGAFAMGSTLETFDAMLDANLLSAVRAIEPIRSRLEDGGRIVAISSAASLTKPAGMAAYVASKAALNGYLESLANELRPRRITVNALLPTALDTPAMRNSMPRDRLVPLERVSETIAFLLSETAQAVTGQLIVLSP